MSVRNNLVSAWSTNFNPETNNQKDFGLKKKKSFCWSFFPVQMDGGWKAPVSCLTYLYTLECFDPPSPYHTHTYTPAYHSPDQCNFELRTQGDNPCASVSLLVTCFKDSQSQSCCRETASYYWLSLLCCCVCTYSTCRCSFILCAAWTKE